jgi:para-nitrobenzyl esterase
MWRERCPPPGLIGPVFAKLEAGIGGTPAGSSDPLADRRARRHAARRMTAVVETRDGRIEGEVADGIFAFRGVPYAAPPVGPLRWRAPASPKPWAGVREARRFGAAAPQPPSMAARLFGSGAPAESEDCLTLNLFTPGLSGRRPVLVWIHGGAFVTGAGSMAVYDGAGLAREANAVVVTLNYRLGALGFLYLPEQAEGDAAGNFGLLDQLAALAWVREHADRFGGDAGRITLFGQSAGAMCIGTLLGAPRARGQFARAILQSGASSNVHRPETAERVTFAFARAAGLARGDLARLRGLPVPAVAAAQAAAREALAREIAEPAFQPVVDGALLPEPPLAAIANGAARDVPLLLGTNLDEWNFYGLGDPGAGHLDDEKLLRRFRRGLPGHDGTGRELAVRVVELYRTLHRDRSARDLWFAIQTDRWFRHPAVRLAELQARNHRDVHAYLFTWPSPAFGGGLGACHALDLPFVWGTHSHPPMRPIVGDADGAAALSRRMQGAWIAFAHGGAPAHPELPDWPAYEPGRRATLELGATCRLLHAPGEAERAFWDEIAA